MIRVKVCGMREPGNAREVAISGPDYMGYIFYPFSRRYVGDNPDPGLFHQTDPGVLKVGVFVNESSGSMVEIATRYSLDLVQLHGSESPDTCATLRSKGLQVIKTFGVDQRFEFEALAPYLKVCDFFLLDTKSDLHGGTGLKFNWEKIGQYHEPLPFFLSGGIEPTDAGIIKALRNPALYAVDINSRFETEPGIKNIQQVRSFIKEIKSTTT